MDCRHCGRTSTSVRGGFPLTNDDDDVGRRGAGGGNKTPSRRFRSQCCVYHSANLANHHPKSTGKSRFPFPYHQSDLNRSAATSPLLQHHEHHFRTPPRRDSALVQETAGSRPVPSSISTYTTLQNAAISTTPIKHQAFLQHHQQHVVQQCRHRLEDRRPLHREEPPGAVAEREGRGLHCLRRQGQVLHDDHDDVKWSVGEQMHGSGG